MALSQLKGIDAQCILACDIDADARHVYEDNFGIEPKTPRLQIESSTIELVQQILLSDYFSCYNIYSMEGNTHAPNETKIAAAFHQGDAFLYIFNELPT